MAEEQVRQDAQAVFCAEQLNLVRQEREAKTELAPPAPSFSPATSKLDGGSSCTSCPQLVAAADPNLNKETCPQLATAVQDMQRQMQEIQVSLDRARAEAAKQPRVAFPRDGVPLGTRDRSRRSPSNPLKRLEEFEYRRDTTGWSDEEGPVCTGRSCKTSRHFRNQKHRHSRSRGNSTSSSESEGSNDQERRTPYGRDWDDVSHHRTLPSCKGPRMRGMKELHPSNPLFKDALSYRRYRLRNVSQETSYELSTEPGKAAAILRPIMKRYVFDGTNPAWILRFLQVFKRQCDNHKFSEGEAFLALPYFLTDHASDAFNASCEFGDTSSGGITNYCDAVQFLLRLFAKDRYLDDAKDKLDAVKQRPDEDEVAYAHRLHDSAHNFGPVFVERDLITGFINGLTDALKPMLRAQHFRPNHLEGFHDVIERAASIGDSFRAFRHQHELKPPARSQATPPPKRASVNFVDTTIQQTPQKSAPTQAVDQVGLFRQVSPSSTQFFTPAESFNSEMGADSEHPDFEDAVLAAYAGAAYKRRAVERLV